MAQTVSVAYARTNLPKLVKEAEKGQTIILARYGKPVAKLSPADAAEAPLRRMGTGKGRIRILDPRAFDPMTDEEVDDLLEGHY